MPVLYPKGMENYKNQISAAIKELRLFNHLTQEEFAEKCAISYDSLRKWETKINVPTADNIDKICNAFNITAIDLFGYGLAKSKQQKIKNIQALLTGADDKQLEFIANMIKLVKAQ